jgi:CheY-like chemotaxis protein
MAKSILIADDSQDDVVFFTRVLGRAGLRNPYFVVGDGVEVIAYLKGEPPFDDREQHPLPAILFLDLRMRRLHGEEVLQWLQKQPHLSEVLVFVVSHLGDAKTFATAYALGAKSFLTKPVQLADVHNLILHFPGHWIQSPMSLLPPGEEQSGE